MWTRYFFSRLKQLFYCALSICFALGFTQCGSTSHYAFLSQNQNSKKIQMFQNVAVKLELSKTSLIGHKFALRNFSGKSLILRPKNISLVVYCDNDNTITLNPVEDYDTYVMRRYLKAKNMCKDAPYPYTCADGIDDLKRKQAGRTGFKFGSIQNKETRSGYIAFDLPDPINVLHNTGKFHYDFFSGLAGGVYKANLHIKIDSLVPSKKFAFPVEIRVVKKADELPYEILRFL